MIDKLIAERGLDLECKLTSIPTYKDLINCERAAKVVSKHLIAKKSVIAVTDFDVDGITSTALIMRFLKPFPNISYFVPNRFDQGYGLTHATVDIILKTDADLVITFDNGITAREQVTRLQAAGKEVIITDHHVIQPDLVPDTIVVNPKQDNNELYDLAGVGVAFYLIAAIRAEMKLTDCNLYDYLDLVALGTVADLVPLTGVNRILVTHGLKVLNKYNRSNFYKHVFQQNRRITEWKADTIGYQLAPILNASGRLKDADIGVRFLMSDTTETAQRIYGELNTLNKDRQKLQVEMTNTAMKKLDIRDGIVVFNKEFNEGLIGLIASKISEKHGVPIIVLTESKGRIKGSCRSSTTGMLDILHKCSEHLGGYGGHEGAAGCTVLNLKEFTEQFYKACTDLKSDDDKVNLFHYDGTLKWEEVTLDLLDQLKKMQPFGMKNSRPVFKLQAGLLNTEPTILKDKHLKWSFGEVDVVYWNHTTLPRIKEVGVTIDEGYSSEIQLTVKWVR